jgi:uncharacterized protein
VRNIRLYNSVGQMALALAGFLVVCVLLESEGLASWANHLEIGPLRVAAVPVTGAVAKAMRPLGVFRVRDETLDNLARVGWSDDVARVAAVNIGRSSAADSGAKQMAKAATPLTLGAETPLVREVPRLTKLAPLPPVEAGKTRVVALAGDSMMAVGLSSELMREAASDSHLKIVKAFRSGTGLARPEVFDWMTQYPAMLGAEKPDVVLVAIGANDGQGFVVDGKVLPFGSDGWSKVYQQRVADYLAMVGAGGARVVWVGLPPMRVASYDDKMAAINKISYTVVSQSPTAVWWNPVPFVGDEMGRYREYAPIGKNGNVRLRQADGVHLSDEGASLLTSALLKWLDPPAVPVAGAAVADAVAVAAPPVANAVKPKKKAHRANHG